MMKKRARGKLVPLFFLLVLAFPAVGEDERPLPAGPVLSRLGELDGRTSSPAIGAAEWRQALHDARRAVPGKRFLPEAAAVLKKIAERSERVILVADSSKYGKTGFVSILPLSAVGTVITDTGLPEEAVARLEEIPVEVIRT
jgi:hypothetical protein